MKKLVLGSLLVILSFNSGLNAQKENQGVYLSANDFTKGKISYVNEQNNEKYKFHQHELFNPAIIKIIKGDKIIKLKKDSIFGFRDKNNICYRYYNKAEFKIINTSDNILLYSKSSLEGGLKNKHLVTNYYFSANANSPIYELTKWNLKTVFINDISFQKLLDIHFQNDNELTAYDSHNKTYDLNRIYEISKK